ncbi:MAG: hypothetical protein ABIO54_12095, partial [Pyrinomonadaceae bacterium]
MIDSYLSDELLVETNHDVLRHLENCSDCRTHLASSRELRDRLRSAVKTSADFNIESAFAKKLSGELQRTALQPGIWESFTDIVKQPRLGALMAAAAFLLVAVFGGIMLIRRTPIVAVNPSAFPIPTVEASNSVIADAVRVAWNELSEQAIGDHENCAVKFNLAEDPITLSDAAKKYGPFDKNIDKTVVAAVKTVFKDAPSDQIHLLEAHSCLYNGRRFTHIVLKRQGKVISVLVTDTDLPDGSDGSVTSHADGSLNAAGFTVGRHAVFVVSEMNAADNSTLARAIYPAIRG